MRALIVLCFLLACGQVWAAPWPVADLAVLVDPTGRETIDSVSDPHRAGDFVQAPRGLAAGYTRTVHWLRFRLDAPPDDRLLLEIQPPYLDDLQLYLPDGAGGFQMRRSGDTHPFTLRDVPGRGFVFRVIFADSTPKTVYLRVETTSTSLVLLRAWQPPDYVEAQSADYLLLGLYYGLLVAMLLFNLWHGHWRHDPEHRAFLFYLLTVLLFMLAVNGLLAQYLAPGRPAVGHHVLSAMVMITTGAAAHFHRRILAIDRATPLLNAYFLGMIGLSFACFIAYVAGYFTEAARVLTLAALLFPIFGIVRTAALWRQGRVGSHLLALAYVIVLVTYLLTVLSVQGLLRGTHWQLYSFQAGTLLALLAFNFSLFDRLRHVARQRDAALKEALQARSERDVENRARQRQGTLLAMLTHELRTPLSVIRLRLGTPTASSHMQANAEQAVAEIDGIVERCALTSRLDEQALQPKPERCDLGERVRDGIARQKEAARIALRVPAGFSGTVHTDPALLAILIANLLDNALKYSPPGSPVQVDLGEQPRNGRAGVLLSVANVPGGAGRPDPATAFDKYYRAPGAHGQSGSGLGLYIARALAALLGAHLDYRADQPDIVFDLWLPHSMS